MDLIHIVVYGFVHLLDPVRHQDLALELPGLVDAAQGFDLPDQGGGLFPGDEPGGLDAVRQELQLRQLEGPLPDKIGGVPPSLGADHVHPVLAQGLQVVVNALPLRVHPLAP